MARTFRGQYNDVQKLRTYERQFWETIDAINSVSSSTSKDKYTEVLQQTFQFCDKVKQQLGPIVLYLTAKRAEQFALQAVEQLETKVNTTVADVVEKLKEVTYESQKQREESEKSEAARQKEFAELQNKLANESAKTLTAEQQSTFAEQAERHQQVAWVCLVWQVIDYWAWSWYHFFGLLDI